MRDFDPTASEFITSGYLERSQPGGVHYDFMSIASVAAPIVGSLIGGDAAEDAANTQAASADRATALQKQMFDKQVELQAPFRETGLQANNRLAYLLGLGESGSMSADQRYQELLRTAEAEHRRVYGVGWDAANPADVELNKQKLRAKAEAAVAGDPAQAGDFGSLMRRFSMDDFEADPGYAFRMKEGLDAVESGAAARGGLLSGAAQKALQKYGQGLASQEYGNAYNRFTADQTNQYNRLAGLVNTGQGATNQTSNAAANFGQQAGANAIGAGNAIASGQIGQANALAGGINAGLNNYQNNRLMDLIRNPSASRPSGPSNSEIWSQINGF